MRSSGTKTRVEHGVVALRRAHPERVPRLDDGHAGARALDEGVHGLRPAGCVGVDGVGAQPGPHRPVGAELLAARQAVAAVDALGDARREQDGDVVAGLGVAGGDDLAVDGGFEEPALRGVAGPFELGGRADPVGVHRHRQRGGRGVAREAPLAGRHLGEVEAPAAEVDRHRRGEVAGGAQLGEVVVEVGVGAIQLGGAVAEPLQHVDRQLGEPFTEVGGGCGVSWRPRCASALSSPSHPLTAS